MKEKLIGLKYIFLILLFAFLTMQSAQASFSVSSTSPSNGDTHIGRNPSFVLTFPFNVCFYMANSYIKNQSNGTVADTILYTQYLGSGTNTITVPTNVTLAADKAYYFEGTSIVYDCISPSNLSSPIIIHFNTGGCTGGSNCCYNYPSCLGPCFANFTQVKHFSPPDNGHFMQNYEGINIIFNGNVTAGAGNIYIRKYNGDTTIETIDVTSNRVSGWGTPSINIDPIGNLSNGTHYYVNFDMEGYSLPAFKDKWDFWTKPTPSTLPGIGL